jgi:DNA mismatch repair protein MutL
LGQAGNTYVVAEGPDGIFLLDQHAAHERVLYEKVTSKMSRGEPSVQALLEPVAVELPPAYLELAEEGRQEMEGYGFLLEPFGGNTYLLRGVPSIFHDSDPAKGLLEVLEMVSRESSLKSRREVLAASIACHGAVRAGMGLSQEEMTEMVALLETAENPHTCPHGRPTMLHLSSQQLERQFGRR